LDDGLSWVWVGMILQAAPVIEGKEVKLGIVLDKESPANLDQLEEADSNLLRVMSKELASSFVGFANPMLYSKHLLVSLDSSHSCWNILELDTD